MLTHSRVEIGRAIEKQYAKEIGRKKSAKRENFSKYLLQRNIPRAQTVTQTYCMSSLCSVPGLFFFYLFCLVDYGTT